MLGSRPRSGDDSSLEPGDLDFISRTADAYVYEHPRAPPRVMLLTDWRLCADRDRRTVSTR
jgi:hypothetical protein